MTVSKLLVANRGEIARRVFRTCHEMGIATVAVFSEPDAEQPHVLEAEEAILLPGAGPAETYLNIEAILAGAKETGADAIHPGYGFLAENAEFARAVVQAGLTWIGPPPHAIELMGSKLESKRLAQSVGVPIIPSIELVELSELGKPAASLGFPVLVKASAGGGGKGMRIVTHPEGLTPAVEAARREAVSAFGDGTVFLEQYLEAPRHIEIQVFGDTLGNVISLYERECSIQRRHQKIIEESPSPAVDDNLRRGMGEAAVAVAKAVDYAGAGTVEFLFKEGSFYFLEMNTRLQVEHPVTEMVTGLDLVRLQIEVADGAALPATAPAMAGHAIEARLYAEDPLNEFLPVTGRFHRFAFPDLAGLRVDSGVEDGTEVSVHYDPLIAKVIAHSSNREGAASTLAAALRRAEIHGSITNRALLVRTLEHPEYLHGDIDTGFLDRHDVAELARPLADERDELLSAVAAAFADQAFERSRARVLTSIPAGWRNNPGPLHSRSYTGPYATHHVSYSSLPEGFALDGLGWVTLIEAKPDEALFTVDHTEHRFRIARYGADRYVDSDNGTVHLVEVPRFPSIEAGESAGSLHAPMPGKVIRVNVAEGDPVTEGQVVVVLEAMKMEHALRSPHAGTVLEVAYGEGDQVETGAVLVVVEEA